MSVNEKMTSLAGEIRKLSGTESKKSLDVMTSDVNAANLEIAEQTALLEQIVAALDGKGAGSGGTQLPTLTNEGSASDLLSGKQLIDGDGNVVTGTIPTKTSSDLTANGATVTVSAGYYASNATKTIASGSAKTPATTITKTPSISVDSSGLITASVSGTQSVTPTVSAGYVSSGTAGTITVSGSATKQLTTQAAKTITPSTSSQTAVASGVYTTGAVTVKGDANLKAENIKSGVSIFGVTGTASGSEDLDTELTEQENLISQLSTILDSKASGGSGGVETCTLTLSFGNSPTDTSGAVGTILYNIYENGKISAVYEHIVTTGLTVRENIVKGSSLVTQNSFQDTTNVTYMDYHAYGRAYQIDGDAKLHGYTCFVVGTKILLYNGLSKEVENITYDDELLVWDFDNGCYASAKPLWIKKQQSSSYYYHCKFENGITLNLVGSNGKCHRVFSIDDGRFESATDCVGKMVMTELGATKLVSCEKVEETVEYYNIITKYHLNLFANSVLTSCRLNNLYPIKDMKFVKDNQNYIPYEAYSNVTMDFYEGLRLSERNNNDISWLNDYVGNLYTLMESERGA